MLLDPVGRRGDGKSEMFLFITKYRMWVIQDTNCGTEYFYKSANKKRRNARPDQYDQNYKPIILPRYLRMLSLLRIRPVFEHLIL